MISEKSIAVLPFDNLSSDAENEFFSDGMTEEIINALSQIKDLKVTARTSSFVFKNAKKDIRKIGKELGVSLILEGSVRKSKERLRITAQLIRTADGFHIWSENFDRKLLDIFELQDEISLLIAEKIREHFGHLTIKDQLVHIHTKNVVAYQYYLKGLHYYNKWNMRHFEMAAEEFMKSLNEDPEFDLPYYGIALSYSFLGSWGSMKKEVGFKLAERYFDQGDKLNIPSATAYYSKAKHLFWGLWKYQEAHDILMKAYAIQPQDSKINEFISEIHTQAGNFSTALDYIETSLKIDPLSPSHYYTKANIYFLQNRFPEALEVIEKGLLIESSFAIGWELKMAVLIQLQDRESFEDSLKHYKTPFQETFRLLFNLGREEDKLDLKRLAIVLNDIEQADNSLLMAWDLYLTLYAGHPLKALQLLKSKVGQRMGQVINLKFDPFLAPLRKLNDYKEWAQLSVLESPTLASRIEISSEKPVMTAKEVEYFARLLLDKIQTEKYYLEANFGLRDLAEKINLHPNKLSWLLNNKIGKNFYDFINSYRLKDFQKRAIDPKNGHLSILGIAYDSGFNSKSVFNDYFKKATGKTPKMWVSQNQKN